MANRLSEDPTVNVLLLEAGPADVGEPIVNVPGFIGDNIGGLYDWNLSAVPQVYLDGQPRNIPQGRALGGGTVLNGMLWNRGGQGDYQDWVDLGNPGWSWDDLLPYFIKSETYTPIESHEIAAQFAIQEYAGVHGYDGPVNVSFPRYFWNSSAALFGALNEVGIPTAYDPNSGLVAGASFLPMDVDPESQERCTARRAYYDPIASRPNLWVSTGQTVTQVLFANREPNVEASTPVDGSTSNGQGNSPGIAAGIFGMLTTLNSTQISQSGQPRKRALLRGFWEGLKRALNRRQYVPEPGNLVATGVEYAANAGAPRRTVSASREVIIAAGAIHSPQLLMLSGIGPAPTLRVANIPINIDLPGVGSNLQDHGQVWAWYPYYNSSFPNPTELFTDEGFAAAAWDEYWANRSGPLTTSAIAGVAFPSLPYVVNGSTAIVDGVSAQAPQQYLPGGMDPTIVRGYTQQRELMISALQDVTRAAYELINANDGILTVATMRPFSRGSVTLQSPRPFDTPLIDPRYGSNPVDIEILQAALSMNERLLSTDSLAQLHPIQIFPAVGATDADVLAYINNRWQTEYHPTGTCAMMPPELGGVVSPELLVYGTRNLRVVDSSIMPMLPAAHLQAVVYGVAEKVRSTKYCQPTASLTDVKQAADIIKAAHTESNETGDLDGWPASDIETSTWSKMTTAAGILPSETPTVSSEPAAIVSFVTVVYTQTVYA